MTPDMTMPLLDNLDLFWLLAACVGGIIGAIVGPNNAFGFTGVMILTGFGIAATTGSVFGNVVDTHFHRPFTRILR